MKYFLFFSFVLISNVLVAQRNDYAVLKTGDTLKFYKNAYIDLHSHSQIVRYRDSNNKRKKLSSKDVSKLYIKDFVGTCSFLDKASDYVPMKIITNSGDCTHFCTEAYKTDSFSIWVSPYCSEYTNLYLYVKTDDGRLKSISKKDYKEIIDKYFSGVVAMQRLKDRKFSALRFYNTLKKQQ